MATAQEIIDRFATDYPDKDVIALPEDEPTEIICEVDPTSEHPEYNVAIAAIEESAPHFHKRAEETYEVLEDELTLQVGDDTIHLKPGESHTIKPGIIHSALGNFTLVRVTSLPGWTQEDHILAAQK